MKIFLDETGNLSYKNVNDLCFIVTLVSIPDNDCQDIKTFLNNNNISKGTNINDSDRKKVFQELSKFKNLKYCLVILEPNTNNKESAREIREKQLGEFDKVKSKTKNLEDQYNHLKKLKDSEFMKWRIFHQSIEFFYSSFFKDYSYFAINNDSWNFSFIIDTQNKPFMFTELLKFFLTNSGREKSIECPLSWDDKHPFIKNHIINQRDRIVINTESLFNDIECKKEEEEILLNIPDIIGNTFYRIFYEEQYCWIEYVKLLDRNRIAYLVDEKTFFINAITVNGQSDGLKFIHNKLME